MVARAREYYGTPLRGNGGSYRETALSHDLYVVVYTMIWNWVVVVEAKETGSRSFGREVQSLA